MFPKWLIDKSVKGYLSKVTTTGKDASKCEISNCHFYKLPYIGYYSSYTGRKISSIKYCKDLNVLTFKCFNILVFALEMQRNNLKRLFRCISKFIYCCLQGVLSLFFSVISFLSLSFYWLV